MKVTIESILNYLNKEGPGITRASAIKNITKKFEINSIKSCEIYDRWRRSYIKK